MNKSALIILSLAIGFQVKSQEKFNWNQKNKLSISDFASTASEINSELTTYSISSGATVNFHYQMSSYEFMFTKNFNSKVKNTFSPNSAVIIAPDSSTALKLLAYGQYHFDLSELYARKIRKALYEAKNMGSNPNFFQSVIDEKMEEMNQESNMAMKATDLGLKSEKLKVLSDSVLTQIQVLSEFCETCKPKKRRRN